MQKQNICKRMQSFVSHNGGMDETATNRAEGTHGSVGYTKGLTGELTDPVAPEMTNMSFLRFLISFKY